PLPPPSSRSIAGPETGHRPPSQVVLPLGVGQSLRELISVVGADQPALGGVPAGRHGPVVTGCAATPDSPLRVPAPQLLDAGVLARAVPASAHREARQAVRGAASVQSPDIPWKRRYTCGGYRPPQVTRPVAAS